MEQKFDKLDVNDILHHLKDLLLIHKVSLCKKKFLKFKCEKSCF